MPKTEVMHTINRYVLILVALTALAAVPTARAQDILAKQARAPAMETLTQQLVPSVGAGQKEGALDQERKLAAVVGVDV